MLKALCMYHYMYGGGGGGGIFMTQGRGTLTIASLDFAQWIYTIYNSLSNKYTERSWWTTYHLHIETQKFVWCHQLRFFPKMSEAFIHEHMSSIKTTWKWHACSVWGWFLCDANCKVLDNINFGCFMHGDHELSLLLKMPWLITTASVPKLSCACCSCSWASSERIFTQCHIQPIWETLILHVITMNTISMIGYNMLLINIKKL